MAEDYKKLAERQQAERLAKEKQEAERLAKEKEVAGTQGQAQRAELNAKTKEMLPTIRQFDGFKISGNVKLKAEYLEHGGSGAVWLRMDSIGLSSLHTHKFGTGVLQAYFRSGKYVLQQHLPDGIHGHYNEFDTIEELMASMATKLSEM